MKKIPVLAAIALLLCFAALIAANHWDAHMNGEKRRLYAAVRRYEEEIAEMNTMSARAAKFRDRMEASGPAVSDERSISAEEMASEIERIERRRKGFEESYRKYTEMIARYNGLPEALFRNDPLLPEKLAIRELKE